MITNEDIKNAQSQWAKAVTSADAEAIMKLYSPTAQLKPTLSNQIRRNHSDIKAYFVGSKEFNDSGFLKKNFKEVRFSGGASQFFGDVALDVGEYCFVDGQGEEVRAHYSFVYEKGSNGQLLIAVQHSSLFV